MISPARAANRRNLRDEDISLSVLNELVPGANVSRLLVCVLMLFAASERVQAYTFWYPLAVWPDGTVPMDLKLGLTGTVLDDGNTSWDTVAENALAAWNNYIKTVKFTVYTQSQGPPSYPDGINQVFFDSTVYGQQFGADTLAITKRWTVQATCTEADTVFNSTMPWNSYRGNLRYPGGRAVYDFRRVATHEFGHTLGLGHPDEAGQGVIALMNSKTSNLDGLASDDIAGISALYAGAPPAITSQPQSRTVYLGESVSLTVVAQGNPAPSYQWYFNGNQIALANGSILTISPVRSESAGTYTVLVVNSHGSVLSSAAVLTVKDPKPVITTPPVSQFVPLGGRAIFSVVASGPPPLSYSWHHNGFYIAGATSTLYTIESVQTNDVGSYTVTVSNPNGSAVGGPAYLEIAVPPKITSQPQSQVVKAGNSATFVVGASGRLPMRFQWYQNSSAIPTATSASYIIPATQPTNAGDYRVILSNVGGAVESAIATLTVQYVPIISVQPQSQTVGIGSDAVFSVGATGVPAPTYQWKFKGANITGATSASYTRTNVQQTHSGNYTVVVKNTIGSVTSQTATLTTTKPPTVSLTAPANGATYTAPVAINITALATDPDGSVARVDFYQDGMPIGTATANPYTFAWKNVLAGSYSLSAKATDNLGAVATSANVHITVKEFFEGLVAYYAFNGNANDASGNGNNGTIIGNDWAYGLDRFGGANSLYLNRTSTPAVGLDGAHVLAPRSPLLDFNKDFTMSAWINLKSGTPPLFPQNFISNGWDGTNVNLRVVSDHPGFGGQDLLAFVWRTSGQIEQIAILLPPVRETWWQTTVVRSGTNVSLFKNGAFLARGTMVTPVLNSPTMWFGTHFGSGYPLIGGIDDVRMFNRALSVQEVLFLYEYERNVLPHLDIGVKPARLTLFVAQGTTNQIESCTDLKSWTPFGPPLPATNWFILQDVNTSEPQRFFRVGVFQ